MPKIRIKQMDERIATRGLHMGGDSRRRKLEPGEVVEVLDTDVIIDRLHPKGRKLIDVLFATDKIEIVPDAIAVTRPLDYETYREATVCSPRYKARNDSDERERDQARANVAARLESAASTPPPKAESPAEDEVDTQAPKRRGRRRPSGQQHGEARTA